MAVPSVVGIILAGVEGAGKTALGKEIASDLGYHRIDTDIELEKIYGRSFPKAYRAKQKGKKKAVRAYAERKRDLLETLTDPQPPCVVISTTLRPLCVEGESIPRLIDEARQHLARKWIVVHLEANLRSSARFFAENKKARKKRPRLAKMKTYREIFLELGRLDEEMRPIYHDSEIVDARINRTGMDWSESKMHILAEVLLAFQSGRKIGF